MREKNYNNIKEGKALVPVNPWQYQVTALQSLSLQIVWNINTELQPAQKKITVIKQQRINLKFLRNKREKTHCPRMKRQKYPNPLKEWEILVLQEIFYSLSTIITYLVINYERIQRIKLVADVLLIMSSCHEYLWKVILESNNQRPTETCGKTAWVVCNPNFFNDHAFPGGWSERCTDHERTHFSESFLSCLS